MCLILILRYIVNPCKWTKLIKSKIYSGPRYRNLSLFILPNNWIRILLYDDILSITHLTSLFLNKQSLADSIVKIDNTVSWLKSLRTEKWRRTINCLNYFIIYLWRFYAYDKLYAEMCKRISVQELYSFCIIELYVVNGCRLSTVFWIISQLHWYIFSIWKKARSLTCIYIVRMCMWSLFQNSSSKSE